MADRYWVGGTGTWDSTNTANWSDTSGGSGGFSVPTASDNVIFDAGSDAGGIFTVTMANSPRVCNDFTASGLDFTMTLAGTSIGLTVSGSLEFPATNFTRTYTGITTFNATTTGKTITTNGVAFGGQVLLDGAGGEWTLGSALTLSGTGFSGRLSLTRGTFDTSTNHYSVSGITIFDSDNTNTRTLNLNNSTITLPGGVSPTWNTSRTTGLTFNAGQSLIQFSNSSVTIYGGGLTFYDVSFTSTSIFNNRSISGANTFQNLTFATPVGASTGVFGVVITDDQTISSTLTVTGADYNKRAFVRSNFVGTTVTLTCAAIAAMTDVDFRDITIAGAHGTLSGTRLGDCDGNTNITFDAPKTVYWNLAGGGTWSSNAWALSSGGAVSTANFPLAQDSVIIGNTGLNTSATITINGAWNIGTLDTSTRTNAMTLASGTNAPTFYGDFTYGSGVTPSGASSSGYTFSNRATKTLNSGGKTFTQPIFIDAPGGGIQLLTNNLTIDPTRGTTLTRGTLDLNNLVLTTGTFSSINSNTRSIAFGTGNISCSGTGSVWGNSTVTGFTTTGTQVVNITSSGSTAITVTNGILSEANSISFNFTGGTYPLTFFQISNNTARNVNFTGYAGTLLTTGPTTIYGNLTLSTGMTLTSTNSAITFAATSGTKTITTNGKTLDFPINFNGVGGTWQLQDAMTLGSTRIATLTNGTIDLFGKTFTVGTRFLTGTGTKNITFNGGTLVCPNPNTSSFFNAQPTGFTTTAGTGTGVISMTAATAKTFVGSGSTYNCTLNQGGAGTLTITGANTFDDITNTEPTANQITFPASITTTVNAFTLSGSSGNLVSIRSSSSGTQFTLSKSSGTVSVSFLDIQDSNATGGATWEALASNGNVDSGNNLGWSFGGAVYAVSVSETSTGADAITLVLVCVGAISETATGADTTAYQLDVVGAISETATGADTTAYQLDVVGAISETATGVDTTASQLDAVAFIDESFSPGSIIQNTSALPTGTSFTGSTIFDNTSAGGGLAVVANGTGTGSAGGFNAGGNYILFSGVNTRSVKTIALDLTTCSTFSFSIIRGNSSNGGETPDAGENIVVEYSTNGGGSYTTIATILNTAAITTFTTLSYSMPVGAQTASTIIRWRQAASSQSGFDNYGIKTFTFDILLPGGASAADTTATTLTRIGAISETATGEDTTASQLDAVGAISETATGEDTTISQLDAVGAVLETATGADTTISQLDAVGAVLETATGADTTATALTRVGAISETATGADTTANQLDAVGAISETATGADATQGNIETTSAVSETATGADTTASQLDTFGGVDETATAADNLVTQLDGVANINETAISVDSPLGNIITTLQIAEGATIVDEALARLLWELINDNQLPGWQLIQNPQGTGWTVINTDTPPGWTKIDTI